MTGLLVSVRDATEALAAVRGGASLIDVKEPRHGSLGAATPEIWREVRLAVPLDISCSAALGELQDVSPEQIANCRGSLAGYQFAKLGLSSCGTVPDWREHWRAVLRELPPEVNAVAVIYADWQRAQAPPPDEILRAAVEDACSAILLDTFDKTGGPISAYLSEKELSQILCNARAAGLATVLAGSLNSELARKLLPLAPDYVAVRGAVCRAGRVGTVEESLVASFAEILLSTREGAQQFSTPTKTIFAA